MHNKNKKIQICKIDSTPLDITLVGIDGNGVPSNIPLSKPTLLIGMNEESRIVNECFISFDYKQTDNPNI